MSLTLHIRNAHEIRQKAPKTFGKRDRPAGSSSKTTVKCKQCQYHFDTVYININLNGRTVSRLQGNVMRLTPLSFYHIIGQE